MLEPPSHPEQTTLNPSSQGRVDDVVLPMLRVSERVRPELASAPPMSIAHLMLFTAGTAVYLAASRGWITRLGDLDAANWIFMVQSLLVGPALAALLLTPCWRRQGYAFPSFAGEWLLLIAGCYFLLETIQIKLLVEWLSPNEPSDPYDISAYELYFRWAVLMSHVIAVIVTVLLGVAFVFLRTFRAWRWFLGLFISAWTLFTARYFAVALADYWDNGLSPVYALQFSNVLRYLFVPLALGTFAALVAAIGGDLFGQERLPWTHWLGVAIFVVFAGLFAFRAFGV